MEDIIYGKGIFIHSINLDSSFLIDCLQTLLITYPGLGITSVLYDETSDGYRICFKDSEATTMLENKGIEGKYGYTTLYPMTTFLIIHDVDLIGNNDIEGNLRNKIEEQLGKVLLLHKFATIAKNGAASFLVNIDIPERKGMRVFLDVGYPNMSIRVPGKPEAFKMEFWCRRCKDHGHIFQECSKNTRNSEGGEERRISQDSNDRSKIEMHSRQKSDAKHSPMNLTKNTEIYPSVSNFLESTDSFARKVAREQIMQAGLLGDKDPSKEIFKRTETNELASQVADSLLLGRNIRQEVYISADVELERKKTVNQNSSRTKSSESTLGAASGNSVMSDNILTENEIKKEVTEDNVKDVPRKARGIESQENTSAKNVTGENSVKKEAENILQNEGNTHPFPEGITSSDDDIQVIEHSGNTSSNSMSHLNFRDAFSRLQDKTPTAESGDIKQESICPDRVQNVDLPLKSPTYTPTSPLNSQYQQSKASTSSTAFEGLTDYQLQEYFTGVSSNPSTLLNVSRQQPKPSTSAEVTSCLSGRLQDCITKAYDAHSVLDRKTLDAFLIHVKKKSNPIRVAGNYTSNVQGLKDQLNKILFFYYNTPQTGTKEDIQFIKWLSGLVERFDGTIPRKRKNNKKTGCEPPSKI